MMKALLKLRFRALWAGLTAQGQKKKKSGKGTLLLYAILYLYVLVVICGAMGFLFHSLAGPYDALGLPWLYFSMSGMMGLGFAVIGSVFTTQSQLYDAKDNYLLLSMPIPAGKILLSRMIPLLAMNLVFAGAVMIPAMVVWAVWIEFSLTALLCQIAALLGVVVLAQAIACLLGWLLHLLLRKMNKSFASMLYMVLFLGIYFYVYSQANTVMTAMAQNGEAIANALEAWAWPLYAMGKGCWDAPALLPVFLAICAAVFGLVCWVLSKTFLKSATASAASRKRRKLEFKGLQARSPLRAVLDKELGKFLGTPVFLTNMGLGVVMLVVLAIAGICFRGELMPLIDLLGLGPDMTALLICAAISYLSCVICISAPTVSLEGKSLWVLKSLPISSRDVLLGKLGLHLVLAVPAGCFAGLVLSVTYGCTLPGILLCILVPGLLGLLSGLIGMLAGLKWARFDYISEAYPCKQSAAVAVPMFGLMGLPLGLGLVYGFWLMPYLGPLVFLALCAVLIALACLLLWRVLMTWGIHRWESL